RLSELAFATLRQTLWLAMLIALPISPAIAHSLDQFESELSQREQYFEPVDKPAPSFELKDAEGRPVPLADYARKVIVLHFIYARCPDVCPLHADLISRIQAMVNSTPMRDRVQFLSITTDPVNDTGEVLKTYGRLHQLDPQNWKFLTSGPEHPDMTRRLVEQFGHRFAVTPSGIQIHGVVTHVIDREGRWRGNFHGLGFNPTNLVLFVNALVNDVHPPAAPQSRGWWETIKEMF